MEKRDLRLRYTIACLAVGVLALPARADIIYDNFGGFFPGFFNAWSGPSGQPEADWELAVPFPVQGLQGLDFFLDSVNVGLNAFVGGTNRVTISVYADNLGLPGALVESVLLVDQLAWWDGDPGNIPPNDKLLITAQFSGLSVLTMGETYWVGVGEDGGSWVGWWAGAGAELSVGIRLLGDDWALSTQEIALTFRVNGTPIPSSSGGFSGLCGRHPMPGVAIHGQ